MYNPRVKNELLFPVGLLTPGGMAGNENRLNESEDLEDKDPKTPGQLLFVRPSAGWFVSGGL